MPIDARKTIEELANEWDGCQKCDLHNYRPINLPVMLGGGEANGIMFIGPAPTSRDETERSIFSSGGGRMLLDIVARLQLQPVYYTNLTACRSCTPALDEKMQVRRRIGFRGEDKGIILNDQPPTPPQIEACRARLIEEIYIVDPIVIVALGQTVATALAGTSVKLSDMRGVPMMITIPGAGFVPVFSGKKKVWKRKVKGVWQQPVAPAPVHYHMIPTLDVNDVKDAITDHGPKNPFDLFTSDILKARAMYRRYHEEVTGVVPTYYTDPDLRDESAENGE